LTIAVEIAREPLRGPSSGVGGDPSPLRICPALDRERRTGRDVNVGIDIPAVVPHLRDVHFAVAGEITAKPLRVPEARVGGDPGPLRIGPALTSQAIRTFFIREAL